MTSWVCRQDGTVFTVGAQCCPGCSAQDAYEQGEPDGPNVYETSPEEVAAELVVQLAELKAMHAKHQAGITTTTHALINQAISLAEAEVAERLGDVAPAGESASPRKRRG